MWGGAAGDQRGEEEGLTGGVWGGAAGNQRDEEEGLEECGVGLLVLVLFWLLVQCWLF